MERAQTKGPSVVAIGAICLFLSIVSPIPFFGMFLTGLFARMAMRGATWAWIPTVIFGWVVVDEIGEVISNGIGLPILFIAAGVLVFCHDSIWPPARKIGLIIVGVLILAGLFGGDDHDHRDRDKPGVVDRRRSETTASTRAQLVPPGLADVAGKNIVVHTGEGDVSLAVGSPSASGSATSVRWTVAGNTVTVTPTDTDNAMNLRLPDTVAAVTVRTGSGDVEANGYWPSLTVMTGSGEVDVEWAGDPNLDITTGDGDIDLHGYDQRDPDNSFQAVGADGVLVIRTGEGDIDVTRGQRVLG